MEDYASQCPRFRFTIRSLIITVALVALNLAAAMMTVKIYLAKSHSANEATFASPPSDFTTDGGHLTPSRSRPIPNTGRGLAIWVKGSHGMLRLFSPIIASTAVTFLVLVVPWGRSGLDSRNLGTEAAAVRPHRRPRLRAVARGTAIVAALIILNVATVAYRPISPPLDPRVRDEILDPRWVTIVFELDGSVIGYDQGRGGDMWSPPRVIQPPTRSLFEVWFPVLASGTFTTLVLVVILRRALRQRSDPSGTIESRPRPAHSVG